MTLGLLDLESKAKIDTVYWQLAQQIVNMHRGLRYVPEEVKELETSLGDQYICNFSVFQSLLDHWALGQLFPIMPIHRLDHAAGSRMACWSISPAIPTAKSRSSSISRT